jgi:hypothetical protein
MVRERLNNGFAGWVMLVVWFAVLVGAPLLSYLNWPAHGHPSSSWRPSPSCCSS